MRNKNKKQHTIKTKPWGKNEWDWGLWYVREQNI
jgi:hypothetical protein